jgi:hypothetical protein
LDAELGKNTTPLDSEAVVAENTQHATGGDSMSLKDKYSIVGAATTKFGKVPGVSALAITVEAAQLAMDDAGLKKQDVDAVLCEYPPSGFQSLWRTKFPKRWVSSPRSPRPSTRRAPPTSAWSSTR